MDEVTEVKHLYGKDVYAALKDYLGLSDHCIAFELQCDLEGLPVLTETRHVAAPENSQALIEEVRRGLDQV